MVIYKMAHGRYLPNIMWKTSEIRDKMGPFDMIGEDLIHFLDPITNPNKLVVYTDMFARCNTVDQLKDSFARMVADDQKIRNLLKKANETAANNQYLIYMYIGAIIIIILGILISV